MLRPKVAVGIAVAIVLVFVLLFEGPGHQSRFTFLKPNSNQQKEIEWADIELPHEGGAIDAQGTKIHETHEELMDYDSLSRFEEGSLKVTAASPPLAPTVEESGKSLLAVQTVADSSSTSITRTAQAHAVASPTQTTLSSPAPEIRPFKDSSVRIYIGVVLPQLPRLS